ncbi:hypothetical protein SAMN04489717_3714 [Actinopolymorpha singaporensis]|uniref:Uncharacterized protein n=1 Tax=Actinopolymorpha singaporensis TaxID=117157 RepID=A0A1H1UP22_9ACTN|nr:hypothetical protein SAMN04489717_3714 [Actinopolymorpha singaporensis]
MSRAESPWPPSRAFRQPLRSFDDLVAVLGSDGQLTIRGRKLLVGDCRELVPLYYFPVVSEADLTAKLADLAGAGEDVDGSAFDRWVRHVDPADVEDGGWS